MDIEKKNKELVESCKIALEQLKKIIEQDLDLDALEPEKAKIAAQGKIEAIEGSFKILDKIQEVNKKMEEDDTEVTTKSKRKDQPFNGIEDRLK